MFTGQLRESQQEEITLQEVAGDALNSLIQYCYTGAIEIREDTVETLLATACLLQLSTIVTACCNFLARQLHPSNCLGFSLFAEQQGCTDLLKLATAYTCQHFQQVWKNQEFFMLDVTQMANLLRSDDLNVPNEQEVFHALMAWIQYDPETRKRHIPELLGLIKLPLLQPSVSILQRHPRYLCWQRTDGRPDLVHFIHSNLSISVVVCGIYFRSTVYSGSRGKPVRRDERVPAAGDGSVQMAPDAWPSIADRNVAHTSAEVNDGPAAGGRRNGWPQGGDQYRELRSTT